MSESSRLYDLEQIERLKAELEKEKEAGRIVLQACATACKERDRVLSELTLVKTESGGLRIQIAKLQEEMERAKDDMPILNALEEALFTRDRWRECSEQLGNAILLIKPMAKGYAAAHQVGANDRLITDAEEALAAYERLKGTP